ncbi:NAD-glutamate dehydrogenase [Aquabacterium sp.]|uniref:NAD-glutamate dehydrogenase n=1 Tax=Aquabacterium sp. TaxID=1872578 RepID=UPI002CE74026|nr:NAD-glutamate dehydrogenase [Aquabacterium sp.]HSW06874.1 NAD-glutamate dehydrogenase [Aquabacterium sp.]
MPTTTTDSGPNSEPLDKVIALVASRLPPEQRETIAAFTRQYFGQVDPEDIAEQEVGDLYGAALSHWQFARRREAGQAKLRVFNPSIAEHGWQSTHTIVEIVNDDMPFLVDSVTMEVNRHGLTLHLIIHPLLNVQRDAGGLLQGLDGDTRESFIHVEVDRVPEPAQLEALAADLSRVLADVRVAVGDWQPMRQCVQGIIAAIDQQPPQLPPQELAEGQAFLHWLLDNHFTFLGHRSHALASIDGQDLLSVVPGSSHGILREVKALDAVAAFSALPPEVRAYARRPELLVVTKSTARSTVHRPGYLDYIAIKRFDAQGQVSGEDRFLGLFTSTAYSANPADIPLLRRKVADVQARAGLAPGSHAGKALINILDTYPRDELFQTSTDELLHTATGILHLGERQRFRLFVRRDPFERFLSCLIFAPRENYTTELRQKWQAILLKAFQGTSSEFNVSLSESVLARIQITVRTEPGHIPAFDEREIETRLIAAARRWDDDLKAALVDAAGEARGITLLRQFGGAFPAGYREEFAARAAVPDIELMAALTPEQPVAMSLYRPLEAPAGTLRFKLMHLARPLTLSVSLPMLEHMGMKVLDEHPYKVQPQDGAPVWIHDFGLQCADAQGDVEVDALHAVFEEAFAAVLRGEVDNDDFNRLVVAARLPAQQIVVLRAYAKYMRQIGFALSQSFIEATLVAHAGVARHLVELFMQRFRPAGGAEADARASATVQAIEAALEDVANLSEDRVLRQYLGLILATTRSNFWRRDAAGQRRDFVSFKFDSSKVPGLPAPKPMFEIFVYATRFEGVHLRGGRVARGGLRWSDRPEDFRTEVLGLVKAQMVKNTVIVPVGSKGGFVLKRAPAASDREAFMKEGVACYQNYLRGLLDVTDNRVGNDIVPPPDVRRHDDDDPYLVVAADKGTATFSDHANAISKEYGFWLGDAFASGGSVGYDHKAMGITARGAWESVKRHFREQGVDTQTQDFSVAGIGDMSGDVFGNGMLLSRHIRLVAAFDHRHIFLDPSPDAASSFAERERLFALPRSSWADYDSALISAGGGVFARTAKAIALTPQVQEVLGLAVDSLTPTELVNAILKAPVDLLYNGGIGTYVKASSESHAQVGDRANDALRVNGSDLRCKVFAEGGNLGCTQLGRIEFALAGGRINTDAIDNSAGVDTSDHEVNIKILLGLAVAEGELTEKQRNAQLPAMTDEVAALVLRDNIFQTQVLSLTGRVAIQLLDAQTRFMHFLEKAGRLDRAIEYLPDDDQIAERRGRGIGLSSPERAVMLAYSKMWLYDELLASPLPDDLWVATALERYFPRQLKTHFGGYMSRHPLKREIIATHVTNSMLNRVGSTFVHRLCETTGARPFEIVRAYLISREVFGVVALWPQIEALDNQVADAVQAQMLIDITLHLERGTKWFLRSRRLNDDMAATIAHFAPGAMALSARLSSLLEPEERARETAAVAQYQASGVPRDTAERVVQLHALYATLDIAEVATLAQRNVETVAAVYFELSSRLGIPWLRDKIAALPADQHWRLLARGAMADDLSGLQRAITTAVFADAMPDAGPAELVSRWATQNQRALERAAQLLGELRAVAAPDAAMLSVALRELRGLG